MMVYARSKRLASARVRLGGTREAEPRGTNAATARECARKARPPYKVRPYFARKTLVPCTGDDFLRHKGRAENATC